MFSEHYFVFSTYFYFVNFCVFFFVKMSTFNYVDTPADIFLSRVEKKSVYDFNESDDDVPMDDTCSVVSASSEQKISGNSLTKSTQLEAKSTDELVSLDFAFMAGDIITAKLLSTDCDCHLYTKNGPHGGFQRWRCRDRKCRAFVLFCPRTISVINCCRRHLIETAIQMSRMSIGSSSA